MSVTTRIRAVAAVLAGLALGYCLFTFGIALLRVSGSSMEPALHDGAFVLVLRPGLDFLFRSGGPRGGDVVVLSVPGSTERVVKRVAATAGQVIAMHDGVVLVDGGRAIAATVPGAFAGHHSFDAVSVKPGHVYVLGDNRLPLASRDSRDFGPVELAAVRGRVVFPRTGL
ncbi:MAG TPA: signal peptidase I [Trueperaceae bacterium]|nr:signal peptidase I [Trueperaceae bacterium]